MHDLIVRCTFFVFHCYFFSLVRMWYDEESHSSNIFFFFKYSLRYSPRLPKELTTNENSNELITVVHSQFYFFHFILDRNALFTSNANQQNKEQKKKIRKINNNRLKEFNRIGYRIKVLLRFILWSNIV